jgi:uncharacterized protein YecE (DUF72 family)
MPSRPFTGTGSWNYPHRSGGIFYPEGMKPIHWLDPYCQRCDCVEINATFYPEFTTASWRRRASMPPPTTMHTAMLSGMPCD